MTLANDANDSGSAVGGTPPSPVEARANCKCS